MIGMGAIEQNGRVVLLTGASSGIGLALARKLTGSTYRVVATSRRNSIDKMRGELRAESENLLVRSLDVTVREDRERVVGEIAKRWGGVDILVNNAGISYRSVVEHMTTEEEQQQFAVNYFGPMALTRLVLPYMRSKRRGHIINVSSVSGMMAMPTMGAYSASKFALEGASEALWYEMRPWNIRVSLIQPGFVQSRSYKNVYKSKKSCEALHDDKAYAAYYRTMGEFIERLMLLSWATPESIAEKIIKTMRQRHPKLRIPATIDAHLFSIIRRILPRNLYHWVLYSNLPEIKTWVK